MPKSVPDYTCLNVRVFLFYLSSARGRWTNGTKRSVGCAKSSLIMIGDSCTINKRGGPGPNDVSSPCGQWGSSGGRLAGAISGSLLLRTFSLLLCNFPTLFYCALHFAIMIGAVIYGLMCKFIAFNCVSFSPVLPIASTDC